MLQPINDGPLNKSQQSGQRQSDQFQFDNIRYPEGSYEPPQYYINKSQNQRKDNKQVQPNQSHTPDVIQQLQNQDYSNNMTIFDYDLQQQTSQDKSEGPQIQLQQKQAARNIGGEYESSSQASPINANQVSVTQKRKRNRGNAAGNVIPQEVGFAQMIQAQSDERMSRQMAQDESKSIYQSASNTSLILNNQVNNQQSTSLKKVKQPVAYQQQYSSHRISRQVNSANQPSNQELLQQFQENQQLQQQIIAENPQMVYQDDPGQNNIINIKSQKNKNQISKSQRSDLYTNANPSNIASKQDSPAKHRTNNDESNASKASRMSMQTKPQNSENSIQNSRLSGHPRRNSGTRRQQQMKMKDTPERFGQLQTGYPIQKSLTHSNILNKVTSMQQSLNQQFQASLQQIDEINSKNEGGYTISVRPPLQKQRTDVIEYEKEKKTNNDMKFGSKIQNLKRIEWKNSEMIEFQQQMMNSTQGEPSMRGAGRANNGEGLFSGGGINSGQQNNNGNVSKSPEFKNDSGVDGEHKLWRTLSEKERELEKRKDQEDEQKLYQSIFNNWRDKDLITTILSLVGLLVAIVNYEIIYVGMCPEPYVKPDLTKFPDPMEDPRNLHASTNIVRLIILITTILAIGCLIMRQHYKVIWVNTYLQTDNQSHIYYQYNEIICGRDADSIEEDQRVFDNYFIFEIIILLLCPIPYFDLYIPISAKENQEVIYLLSEFLLAFMWIRVYFVVRCLFNYSIYTDAHSMKLCRFYGFPANVQFTFKCYILTKPERTAICLFACTIFILAYILRIFEMPYFRMAAAEWKQFDQYFMSIWCITITLTTVGYGDLTPSTKPGQIIAMFTSLWGAFLISLLVTIVQNVFQPEPKQIMALRHIRLTRQAAKTIQYSIRYFKAKKEYHLKENEHHPNELEKQKKPISFGIILKENERIPEVNENENDRNSQVTFNQTLLQNKDEKQLKAILAQHQQTHKNQAEIDECDICKQNQRALARLSEEKEGHNMHHSDDHAEDEHSHEEEQHKKLLKERQELAIRKQDMLKQLDKFKHESGELRKIKQDRNQEQLMTNRLIKNEVIDIADRLEQMHSLMMKQSKKIKYLRKQCKEYYNVQPEIESFQEGEGMDEGEGEEEQSVYSGDRSNDNDKSKTSALVKQQFQQASGVTFNNQYGGNQFNITVPQQQNSRNNYQKQNSGLQAQYSYSQYQNNQNMQAQQQLYQNQPKRRTPSNRPQVFDGGLPNSAQDMQQLDPNQQAQMRSQNEMDFFVQEQPGAPVPRMNNARTMNEEQKYSISNVDEDGQLFTSIQDPNERMQQVGNQQRPFVLDRNANSMVMNQQPIMGFPQQIQPVYNMGGGPRRRRNTTIDNDKDSYFKASYNTTMQSANQKNKKFNIEDQNFISKRRNPFYINSMKYASKKRRPKVTSNKSLKLGDKNVFKDARVRLILIKNRRQDELEQKMRIAEMNKTQNLNLQNQDQHEENQERLNHDDDDDRFPLDEDQEELQGTLTQEHIQTNALDNIQVLQPDGSALQQIHNLEEEQDPIVGQYAPNSSSGDMKQRVENQINMKNQPQYQRSVEYSYEKQGENYQDQIQIQPSMQAEQYSQGLAHKDETNLDPNNINYLNSNQYMSPKPELTNQFFFAKNENEQNNGNPLLEPKPSRKARDQLMTTGNNANKNNNATAFSPKGKSRKQNQMIRRQQSAFQEDKEDKSQSNSGI